MIPLETVTVGLQHSKMLHNNLPTTQQNSVYSVLFLCDPSQILWENTMQAREAESLLMVFCWDINLDHDGFEY